MKSILELLNEESKYVRKLRCLKEDAMLMTKVGSYDGAVELYSKAKDVEERVVKIRGEIFAALKGGND